MRRLSPEKGLRQREKAALRARPLSIYDHHAACRKDISAGCTFFQTRAYTATGHKRSGDKEELWTIQIKRLSQQLQKDPAALRAIMTSQDGQQLLRRLTEKDQGAGLRQAVQSAVQGDTAAMTQMVRQVLESPGGAELVQRIQRSIPGGR